MTDDDDIDGLAAEYVVGSLNPSERRIVEARCLRDVALRDAIAAWEQRLGTLSDRLPGVAPPPDLYGRILARIEDNARCVERFTTVSARPRVWQSRTMAAGLALAACLLLALGWIAYFTSSTPGILVAQLHRTGAGSTADEGQLPAFAVTIDSSRRSLTIRPVAVQPVSGKSYALWLMPRAGSTPTLLGSISPSAPMTLPWLTTQPLGEFVNSRLIISLESEGDPPSLVPTVPFVFAGALVATDSLHR